MSLADLTPDKLLVMLEDRQEVYVKAKDQAARTSFALERMQKAVYGAMRKAGGVSVEDAKAAVFASDEVVEAYQADMDAQRDKDRAMFAVERTKTAIDLYRTEQSNLRSYR